MEGSNSYGDAPGQGPIMLLIALPFAFHQFTLRLGKMKATISPKLVNGFVWSFNHCGTFIVGPLDPHSLVRPMGRDETSLPGSVGDRLEEHHRAGPRVPCLRKNTLLTFDLLVNKKSGDNLIVSSTPRQLVHQLGSQILHFDTAPFNRSQFQIHP